MLVLAAGCKTRQAAPVSAGALPDASELAVQAAAILDYIQGLTGAPPECCLSAEGEDGPSELARSVEELRGLNPGIEVLKRTGCLGESNRGRLVLQEHESFSQPEAKNEAQKTLSAVNKLRKSLYKEIARRNRDRRLSISEVEDVYALEGLLRVSPGGIVQVPEEGPGFDAFLAGPAGKRLGQACVPEDWVSIPE